MRETFGKDAEGPAKRLGFPAAKEEKKTIKRLT
jgi:hypothetical protein